MAATRWAAGGEPDVWVVEPCSAGVEFVLSGGPGTLVVTLATYYLEEGVVTLGLAPAVAGRLRFAYDADARRALAMEEREGRALVGVHLGGHAVKVVVLRLTGG